MLTKEKTEIRRMLLNHIQAAQGDVARQRAIYNYKLFAEACALDAKEVRSLFRRPLTGLPVKKKTVPAPSFSSVSVN